LVLALVVIGPLAGWWAGPSLARAHRTVQLAARIRLEDSEGLDGRTLEGEAFRATGRPPEELFAEAVRIERQFALGTSLLGLWCAAVVGLKLLCSSRTPRRKIYDIDPAQCVACGRCFLSCPRERLKLNTTARY
jgi:NAD-dependent dihydropyrimidine dehydrogenase PreA subunit